MIDRLYRPDDALLAGVCAELARRLSWNVWAIRGVFVFGMFIQTFAVAGIYLAAALVMGLVLGEHSGAESSHSKTAGLASERLSERGERIADLEKKFKDLERNPRS